MKPVNRAMKDHPAYNRHTVYLFFFDQGTDAAVAGYMPLNGQFGYITGYTAARQAEYYRTIAHEIAHVSDLLSPARNAAGGYKSQSRVLGSTFNLRHTFSRENRYVLSEGTTDNLLDYNGGTALYKYQWDLIHDPEKIWFAWLEEEGEGEYGTCLGLIEIEKILYEIRKANIDGKEEIKLKLFNCYEEYVTNKLKLERYEFSGVKISIKGNNRFLNSNESKNDEYIIKPSEISKTSYVDDKTKIEYIKYHY